MKELFPGYFRDDEQKIKEMWDNCYFAFDANILLNLYRYSDATRKEFLKILEKIKDRVWLPHRSAEEYFNNRLSVIEKQEKSYDESIKSIKSLENDLQNTRQHPFVSFQLHKKAKKIFDELCSELDKNKAIHTKRISSDEIQESIADLFNKNTGKPFTKDELITLIKDGAERYKEKIPPGFKDGSKHSESEVFNDKCKKYGDFIIWSQIIAKSKEIDRPIILVTDDRKDDWWSIFNGKTLGPRPELIKEFKEITNNSFYMYQADRFLELARKNLNEDVSDEIVNEIREVRKSDKIALNKYFEKNHIFEKKHNFNDLMMQTKEMRAQLMQLKEEREHLQRKLISLSEEREQLQKHRQYIMSDENRSVEFESLMRHFYTVCEDHDRVQNQLTSQNNLFSELSKKVNTLELEVSHYMAEYGLDKNKY